MKRTIADYLKQGSDGAFFYRMVETVLSRDKNWARWKIDNCPTIAKAPITPQQYADAKSSARRATTNKKLRHNPIGSLDLKFLSEGYSRGGLDRLKDPSSLSRAGSQTTSSRLTWPKMTNLRRSPSKPRRAKPGEPSE